MLEKALIGWDLGIRVCCPLAKKQSRLKRQKRLLRNGSISHVRIVRGLVVANCYWRLMPSAVVDPGTPSVPEPLYETRTAQPSSSKGDVKSTNVKASRDKSEEVRNRHTHGHEDR